MNFKAKATTIPGCLELQPAVRKDCRGAFVKFFHAPEFEKLGLCTSYPEEYYSVSKRGVVRGLHFQAPPAALCKLVFCTAGEVFDAVVDLRRKSPAYKKHFAVRLSAEKGNMLYIPKGCAHGFCAVSKTATMVYKTSAVYAPEHDTGVLWNSAGIKWPCRRPVLSDRDRTFAPLGEYESKF